MYPIQTYRPVNRATTLFILSLFSSAFLFATPAQIALSQQLQLPAIRIAQATLSDDLIDISVALIVLGAIGYYGFAIAINATSTLPAGTPTIVSTFLGTIIFVFAGLGVALLFINYARKRK